MPRTRTDQEQFLCLHARHNVAKAVFEYEQKTGEQVSEIVITRVEGRKDALIDFVVVQEADG